MGTQRCSEGSHTVLETSLALAIGCASNVTETLWEMSARSVISRRSRSHSDTPEKPTFAEELLDPPPDADGEPYICRFPDTEDSNVGKGLVAH